MFLLIIGVVLIIVGALVYRELGPEPLIRLAAALIVLGGLILAIIGIIDLAGASDAHAAVASYGKALLAAAPDSYGKA